GGLELWLDAPQYLERQPDGLGANNPFTHWSAGLAAPPASYTMTLAGASFAGEVRSDQAAVAWAWVEVNGGVTSFTADMYYQHTPTGELITVERIAQGRFVVDMGTLPSSGVPQVTAYDGNHAAVIERWTVIDGS